jgi:restriction endonuclease in pPIWI_RE module
VGHTERYASKRRAIANARQIVPFSSHFAWLDALRAYIRDIPPRWRNYDFDPQRMDERIINAVKRSPDQIRQEHQKLYEQCLRTTLAF